MQHRIEVRLDAASGLATGARPNQQDAVASDFPLGTGFGLAVLADGMGGHPCGELAAQIAITEVFSDLKLCGPGLGGDIPRALLGAAQAANRCLAAQVSSQPDTAGMGTTLLAVVVDQMSLHWLSIGDSLLLLWRDGALRQLNQRHRLTEQSRLSSGWDKSAFANTDHLSGQHILTSCLNGQQIAEIDVPRRALALLPGDLLLMASDGVETLPPDQIAHLLAAHAGATAAAIALLLLQAIAARNSPDQDNVALTVICPHVLAAPPLRRVQWRQPVAKREVDLIQAQVERTQA